MAVNDLNHVNSAGSTLNLNDGSTYTLADIRGIYTIPNEPVIAAIPRKLPTGIYQVQNMLSREIELDIVVGGASLSAVQTNLRALWTQFWVDIRGDALGTLTYTAFNSVVRSIKCIPGGSNEPSKWWVGPVSADAKAVVTITLTCPDPTFYNATPVIPGASAFNNNTPVTVSCANAGDCDAYPTITYTGTAVATVNPKVTDGYGNFTKMEMTISNLDTLVMNLNPQTLSFVYTPSGGAAANAFGYRSNASTLVVCKYGTVNLTFVADSGTAAIGISFLSRYSMHG